jgi:hypothetical protein
MLPPRLGQLGGNNGKVNPVPVDPSSVPFALDIIPAHWNRTSEKK